MAFLLCSHRIPPDLLSTDKMSALSDSSSAVVGAVLEDNGNFQTPDAQRPRILSQNSLSAIKNARHDMDEELTNEMAGAPVPPSHMRGEILQLVAGMFGTSKQKIFLSVERGTFIMFDGITWLLKLRLSLFHANVSVSIKNPKAFDVNFTLIGEHGLNVAFLTETEEECSKWLEAIRTHTAFSSDQNNWKMKGIKRAEDKGLVAAAEAAGLTPSSQRQRRATRSPGGSVAADAALTPHSGETPKVKTRGNSGSCDGGGGGGGGDRSSLKSPLRGLSRGMSIGAGHFSDDDSSEDVAGHDDDAVPVDVEDEGDEDNVPVKAPRGR